LKEHTHTNTTIGEKENSNTREKNNIKKVPWESQMVGLWIKRKRGKYLG